MSIRKIPITVVPHTDPPIFRWKQRVKTPNGDIEQNCEGSLPASVEIAVMHMVEDYQRVLEENRSLQFENAALKGQVDGMTQRIEELQSAKQQQSQSTPPAPATTKKTKT